MDDEENYLAHYGVKGMKWGQRKSYQRTGRRGSPKLNRVKQKLKSMSKMTVTGLKKHHEESKVKRQEAKELRKKNKPLTDKDIKNMSDEELTRRINRILKEEQYKRLTMTPQEKRKERLSKAVGEMALKATKKGLVLIGRHLEGQAKKKVEDYKKAKADVRIKALMSKHGDVKLKDVQDYVKKARIIEEFDDRVYDGYVSKKRNSDDE